MTATAGDPRPIFRRTLIAAAGLGLAAGSIVALPTPAVAAADCSAAPGELTALQAALPASGAGTVGLGPGFPVTTHTDQLAVLVGSDVTLDLCGRTLDVAPTTGGHAGVSVPPGASLTIVDSLGGGILRATGADGTPAGAGAGIGGDAGTSSGHIRIHGGTIIATGGARSGLEEGAGAGIGGGSQGDGNVTILGGTITATGGGDGVGAGAAGIGGAGIGGGGSGSATRAAGVGRVTIDGGTITATADVGAGIGGGGVGDNTIEGGAGAGYVTINGGEVTASTLRYAAAIGGGRTGTGVVRITGGHVTASGLGLGAPALGSGVNGRGGEVIITGGHVTAAGAGGAVGSYSPPADSPPQLLRISGGLLRAQALSERPTIGGGGGGMIRAEIVGVELNDNPGPWVAGAPEDGSGVPATVTATGTGRAFTIDTSPSETRIAFTTGLAITSAPATAAVGDTITVTASVLDHDGQPLADVSSRLTLASSVATDVISGNTVTFTGASPHTITASFGGHTASFTVEVTGTELAGEDAAGPELAATGVTDPLPLVLGGGVLLLLGGGLAAWAFRRRRRTSGSDGYPPFTPAP